MVQYLDNKSSGFNQFKASADASKAPSKFSGIFWWIILFLASWWLISSWLAPSKSGERRADSETRAETVENIQSIIKQNDVLSAKLQGLRLSDFVLKNYDENKNSDKKITLFSGDKEFVEIGLLASGTTAPTMNTQWKVLHANDFEIESEWTNSDKVKFKRGIKIGARNFKVTDSGHLTRDPNDYNIYVWDQITNNSGHDITITPYVRLVRAAGAESTGVSVGGIAYVNNGIEKEDWRAIAKKSYAFEGKGKSFVGFQDQYWEVIAQVSGNSDLGNTVRMKQLGDELYQADMALDGYTIKNGDSYTIGTPIFAGPKDAKILAAASAAQSANEIVGATRIAGLTQTMDYGWFWFLARPFLWCLTALNSVVANYGLAIILLTIGLRILMWPLTRKSYTAMASMQKMQPELVRIQKLYANDKVRMQMEMTKLYQLHKASPMSGCLPMLLQIPIFFALYKALLIAVPLRHAGFLWLKDLSVMDPYFILPILMGATMWWQQRLQSAAPKSDAAPGDMAAQMQKTMKWLPIIFTALFAFMPSGLVLYWTVSNLFGIGQMFVIKKSAKRN